MRGPTEQNRSDFSSETRSGSELRAQAVRKASQDMRARLASNAPLHMREGGCTPWEWVFLWLPVVTVEGRSRWLTRVWRRRIVPAAWFCPPVGDTTYWEYSTERRGLWELPSDGFSHAKTSDAPLSEQES